MYVLSHVCMNTVISMCVHLSGQVLQRYGRYPPALAERLKAKKLLQWVVTHPTNIASANFLSGAHKVQLFFITGHLVSLSFRFL